jgi:hypothetical protein
VCELLWVSAPSTIIDPFPLSWLKADTRRTRLAMGAATLLSSHAGHPRPATSDTTEGSQAHRPTASKRVSSPPGRDHLPGVGHHRQTRLKQQASKRKRQSAGGDTIRQVTRRALFPAVPVAALSYATVGVASPSSGSGVSATFE